MSWLRSLSLLALGIALGCQNNTIMLEFETRSGSDDDDDDSSDTETPSGGDMMTATTDSVSDTTESDPNDPQTLLLALSTPLGPDLPFQALVTVTVTPGADAVDLSMQWLSLEVGSVLSPRQPVGDVYAYAGLPVDDSGVFFWDTGVILIPGAANPLTGQDLVVSVQANVVPSGSPEYCGEAGGLVLMPDNASLDVSTHAMTAVNPNDLPVDFSVRCP